MLFRLLEPMLLELHCLRSIPNQSPQDVAAYNATNQTIGPINAELATVLARMIAMRADLDTRLNELKDLRRVRDESTQAAAEPRGPHNDHNARQLLLKRAEVAVKGERLLTNHGRIIVEMIVTEWRFAEECELITGGNYRIREMCLRRVIAEKFPVGVDVEACIGRVQRR